MNDKTIENNKTQLRYRTLNWHHSCALNIEHAFNTISGNMLKIHGNKVITIFSKKESNSISSITTSIKIADVNDSEIICSFEFSYITGYINIAIYKKESGEPIYIHTYLDPTYYMQKHCENDLLLMLFYSSSVWKIDFNYKTPFIKIIKFDYVADKLKKHKRYKSNADIISTNLINKISSEACYTSLFKGGVAMIALYLASIPIFSNTLIPIEKEIYTSKFEINHERYKENNFNGKYLYPIPPYDCNITSSFFVKCETMKYQEPLLESITSAKSKFDDVIFWIALILFFSSCFSFILNISLQNEEK